MFDIILNEKANAQPVVNYSFLSERLWRLATLGTSKSTTEKGVNNGSVYPCAFDIRPSDKSVSLNRLEVEVNPSKDAIDNHTYMSRTFSDKSLRKMMSIYLSTSSLGSVFDDPESKKLMKHLVFEETANSKKTHKGICGYHWDIFYLCENGNRLTTSSPEMKSDYIAHAKSFLAELSNIP